MEERKKHKVMIGIEVVLLCMLVAILGTNAASSNPPSNGVSYGGNNQTTVEGALNDLYNKANYGNASEGQILKGKTALVGGKKITGTMSTMEKVATDKKSGVGHANALRVDLSADSSDSTNNFLFFNIPQNTYTGDIAWVRATESQVASAIGLTAGKLLKGESVLGITGTGETGYSSCSSCCPSCPTLASQTSSATAGAGDILSGKTAYVNGNKITGTMTNKGAVSGTVSPGGTYTILAGYHNGSGKVTASSCPTCPPSIIAATFIDSGDFTDSITKEINAEVGAYYLLYKGATINAVSNDSFSGCEVLLVERTNGAKYNVNGNTIQLRSVVALVKATSSKITISTSNPKGKGYKYAKISS